MTKNIFPFLFLIPLVMFIASLSLPVAQGEPSPGGYALFFWWMVVGSEGTPMGMGLSWFANPLFGATIIYFLRDKKRNALVFAIFALAFASIPWDLYTNDVLFTGAGAHIHFAEPGWGFLLWWATPLVLLLILVVDWLYQNAPQILNRFKHNSDDQAQGDVGYK